MATTSIPKPAVSESTFDSTLASARTTMMFSDVVGLAIDSFRASKIRFLLTMLGMVIGSASIILVVTVGHTGKNYALDAISSLGPNKIEMQYTGGDIMGPDNTSTPDKMTREDMRSVIDQVPGIVWSSPMLEEHEPISMGGGVSKSTMLLGVSPEYRQIRGLILVAGRFFDGEDATGHAKVTVLNQPLADELFGGAAASIDRTISIKGIPFTVIGVFRESIDTLGMSEINDETMLIPYEVARYFAGTDQLKEIFFTVADSSMVEPSARRITEVIHSRHRPSSVYNAQTLTGILHESAKVADILTVVLTLTAAITLIVSGVGIMNSMLANVQSRLREIGIRKALGATRREIRLQFLTEAVFLSLAGGIVGTVLGLGLPYLVGLLTPYKLPIDWLSGLLALATSVVVGVVFGTVPANRAARLDPVETLKYE